MFIGIGLSVTSRTVRGVGPELVLNGTFNTDLSSWTDASTAPSAMSWSSGQAVSVTDGVNAARLRQSFTTIVGVTYRISSTGTLPIRIGTVPSAVDLLGDEAGATRTFVATTTTTWISTFTTTNGLVLDNVSCRRLI